MGQGNGKHIVESPLRNAEEGKNKTGKKKTKNSLRTAGEVPCKAGRTSKWVL